MSGRLVRTTRVRALVLACLAMGVVPVTSAAPVGAAPGGDDALVQTSAHDATESAAASEPAPLEPTLLDATSDGYIVQFAGGVDAAAAATVLDEFGIAPIETIESAFVGAHVELDAATLAALRADGRVLRVMENTPMETPLPEAPTTPEVSAQAAQVANSWALDRVDQRRLPLNGGFDSPLTGAGVTAYVLDAGVMVEHSEFSGRAFHGAWANDGTAPAGCQGHGTHVAGLIGGETYGVAKDVTLINVRTLGCDGTSTRMMTVSGLNWIIEHHQAGTPAVINMSLGGTINSMVDAAVNAAIADGIVVVVAAGNEGLPACFTSPGGVPGAITVAATDTTDWSPWWSNYGSCVDIFAPGDRVLSAWNTSTVATQVLDGTSMAAPLVTGAVALILQESPQMTPAQVAQRLYGDATTGLVRNGGTGSPNRLLFVPSKGFVAVSPARLMDSRPGATTIDGQFAGIGVRPSGVVTELQVGGRGGVPMDASAVVLNVTVTQPGAAGFVTVFPCGTAIPNGSNLNFWEGATIPNAVVAKVGTGGRVCLYSNVSTHLLVDVNGFYPGGSSFVPLSPARLMDSRPGATTIDGQFAGTGVRFGGVVTELQVGGRGGVPMDASAVVLNVTVTQPGAAGFVTVFPCGTAIPNGSNLNFWAGATIPNAVVAKVGSVGRVCLYSNASTHLLVDVNGFYPAGSSFVPLSPARLADTRPGTTTIDGLAASAGWRLGGYVTELQVGGRGGVPMDASAVVLNVTVTQPMADGFVTVFPCGTAIPNGSNLNFWTGATIPNAVVAKVGVSGRVCIYTNVNMHLIVDVNGFQGG
jgi:subtilisin family serine protease